MTPNEYCSYDAMGLAELIRSGAASQRELAMEVSHAVAALNPRLNAVIECFEDRVRDLGDKPDDPDAPFAGVPWLLKDVGSGEVGCKQEQGSRLLKDYVLDVETHLSTRMRKAGLINMGRTTIPEFAYDGNTESILTGVTCNPWDTRLIAGGSSGGAAVSVASGMVPVAHASDGGGSIRLPASLNGLVGLKPTRGRISTWPIFIADRPLGHATEFVVSRTVRDSAAFLDAFNGPAPAEPRTLPAPEASFLDTLPNLPSGLNIAVNWDNGSGADVHPAMVTAIKAVASLLEQEGHHVSQDYPKVEFHSFATAMTDMWAVEIATMLDYLSNELDRPLDETTLENNALGLFERSQKISGQKLMEAMLTQDACNKLFHDFLDDYDVLITPTTGIPAPKLGSSGPFSENPWVLDFAAPQDAAMLNYTFQANASGQPAISLPLVWTDEGLPIGMQFQARYGDEAILLQLAWFLETAMPWSDRIAPNHYSHSEQ